MLSQFRMETSVIFRRVSVGFTCKFWLFHVVVLQRKAMKYTHFLKKTHALNYSSFVLPLTHCSRRHDLFKVPKIWQSFISFDLDHMEPSWSKFCQFRNPDSFYRLIPIPVLTEWNAFSVRKFKISPCCLRTKSCHLLSFSHWRRGTPEALHLRFSSARTNWKRKLEGWCVKTAQPYKEVWKMTWSVKKTRNFVKVAVIFGFSRWPFDFFVNFVIRLPRLFSRFLSK